MEDAPSSGEALSEHSKSVAKGSFWTLLGSVVFKLISFVYVIIIARMASQDDVGIFYLALGICGIAGFLAEFGILGSLTRYVPYFEGKGDYRKVRDLLFFSFLSVIPAILAALIVFFAAGIIGSFYHNDRLVGAMQFLSVFIALNGIYKIVGSFLVGRADMKSNQLISNIQNVSKLILAVALFYLFGASIATLCASYALSYIPSLIVSYFLMRKHISTIPDSGEPLKSDQLIHEIIPFGFMLSLLGSFVILISSTDRMFLGWLMTGDDSARLIALYSMAANLGYVIALFPGSIGGIFLPLISRLFGKDDKDGMRALMETSQRWMLFITLPISLILILFPSELLSLFYGSQYAPAGMTMAIFTIGIVIQSFSSVISLVLAGARRIDIELKIMGAAGVINVILSIPMIIYFGIEGAAAASAFSFLVMTILTLHFGKKLFGFEMPKEAYKLTLAFILAGVIILAIKPAASSLLSFLPSIGSGDLAAYSGKIISLAFVGILTLLAFAIFVPSALILKCFKKEDIELMKGIMRRAMVPRQIADFAERMALYGVSG